VTKALLQLKPLTCSQIPSIVDLDKLCFGGIWTREGYEREITSPNSTLLVLSLSTTGSNDREILGFGCLWAILEEAHITILAVKPHASWSIPGTIITLSLTY